MLPDDILKEAVPGNIRRAEHFTAFLARFVEYLKVMLFPLANLYLTVVKTRMRVLHVVAETPASFLQHLKDITFIEKKPLKFCAERLTSLVRTLELQNLDEFSSLSKVASFATLVATYDKGQFLRFGRFLLTSLRLSADPRAFRNRECNRAESSLSPHLLGRVTCDSTRVSAL